MDNDYSQSKKAFLDELQRHRLLIPTGVPGVYGYGAAFEDILEGMTRYITRATALDGAEFLRFPPVHNRRDFETGGFLKGFPHLAGSVFSFNGNHQEHMQLIELSHGHEDWSELQQMTDMVLAPAACYPLYPLSTGTLPDGGRLYDVFSYCFRHEPSSDPARMQMFRMREFVRITSLDEAQRWRDCWIERGLEVLRSIGLPVAAEVANDPFFGRGGKLLAGNQRDQKLKFELLMPICSTEQPTALLSCNYHQDHFGSLFNIKTASGEVAHTACIGWGMERITLGLIKIHGVDPKVWPGSIREQLWP